MAVPLTNTKFSDIWSEANGTYSTGILSLNTMSFFSYFAGPNGSNSQPDNNWGQGEASGANRIYGTSAKTTNISVGDFNNGGVGLQGLTYFYDNATFQVTLNITNNLISTPPPPFPIDNDVNVNVELYDSGFSYQYLAGGGMATAPGTFGPTAISSTDDPIIFRAYWIVTVSGAFPTFAGGTCNIDINGNNFVNGGAVPAGLTGASFDSLGFGTADVAAYGAYTGLTFDVTVN
jgi:hypothetical protein